MTALIRVLFGGALAALGFDVGQLSGPIDVALMSVAGQGVVHGGHAVYKRWRANRAANEI